MMPNIFGRGPIIWRTQLKRMDTTRENTLSPAFSMISNFYEGKKVTNITQISMCMVQARVG